MLKAILSFFATALLSLSLIGSVVADEVKGKISKVGNEGREITIKAKDGKEITVKISGSRTTIDGVKSRSDLKEGQSVTVEYEKDDAKKVMVTK
ncbi:MAG TPA: hypothetical protein VLJ79_13880 [Candidatus Binatia bacterium]|nr:hypothetical protein [Candidatus Binatia bacterium]